MLKAPRNPLQDLVAPALIERIVLLLNHVLYSEPVALARLAPHAGRRIVVEVDQWPSGMLPLGLLPPPPALDVRITAAGLLEACMNEEPGPADLRVRMDASDPLRLLAQGLAGQTPSLQLEGDAQLAADVNWLVENLRWDVAADLERMFGPVAAVQISRWGRAIAEALRKFLLAIKARVGQGPADPSTR